MRSFCTALGVCTLMIGGPWLVANPETPSADSETVASALASCELSPLLEENARNRVNASLAFYRSFTSEKSSGKFQALLTALEFNSSSSQLCDALQDFMDGKVSPDGEGELEQILNLALKHPDAEKLRIVALSLARNTTNPENMRLGAQLARQTIQTLLQSQAAGGDSEKRQWLFVALLHYGNASCQLQEVSAALKDYQRWLEDARGKSGGYVVFEAAILFYIDVIPQSSDKTSWWRRTSLRERYTAELAQLRKSLEEWDFQLLPVEELRRRVEGFTYAGEPTAAENLLRRQLVASGNAPEYRKLLAEYLVRGERLAEAAQMYDLLHADFPAEWEYLYGAGVLAMHLQDYWRAVQLLSEAARNAENVAPFIYLAQSLSALGEREQADAVLAGLPQDDFWVVLTRLGTLTHLRKFSQAVDLAAREELRVEYDGGYQDPKAGQAFYSALFFVAYSSRNLDLIRHCLEKSARYGMLDDAMWCNNAGYAILELNGDLEQAGKLLHRAYQLSPEAPETVDSMAWYCLRKNDLSQAQIYIVQALELLEKAGRRDGVVLDHAGDIFWAAGKPEEAKAFWRSALETANSEIDPIKIKKKLEQVAR